ADHAFIEKEGLAFESKGFECFLAGLESAGSSLLRLIVKTFGSLLRSIVQALGLLPLAFDLALGGFLVDLEADSLSLPHALVPTALMEAAHIGTGEEFNLCAGNRYRRLRE